MARVRLAALPFAFLLLLCAPLVRAQSDLPATPSNSSTFTPAELSNTQHAVASRPGASGGYFDLQTLTTKATNSLNHSSSANITSDGIGPGLANVPGDTGNLTGHVGDNPIAYVSCDPSAYSGFITMAKTIQNSIDANASAIILYSTTANFCNLSTNLSTPFNDYGNFFSMINAGNATFLSQALTSPANHGYLAGIRIGTLQSYQNAQVTQPNYSGSPLGQNNEQGTGIAMIVLYSITGVIALLFVIIIVTGAVRAHRHPERYGPRSVAGRPRQNRAMGIGRAMLETLPLVKFGESTPQKPADVEMNDVSRNDSQREVTGVGGQTQEDSAAENTRSRTSASAGPKVTKVDASGKDADGMNHHEKVEKSLECAICWDDFEKGEEVRMLPCEHKFHPKCIDPWLLGFSGTCPVCRVDFGPKDKPEGEASTAAPASGPAATAAPPSAPAPASASASASASGTTQH